jgi:serine/threonine-protein kinase
MAEVWLAQHTELMTDVAVKLMLPEQLARDTDHLLNERFRFEAQVSARLASSTRHIVSVHDAGVHPSADGDVPYLVMELVAGRTLEQAIDEGPLDPGDVATILRQLGEVLDRAHAIGVLHRDIKPSNVLLIDTDAGLFAKLADFGIAKSTRHASRDRAGASAPELDRPRETQVGLMVGTPAYMSPEQVRGDEALTPASDLFNLGVLAYEALTGHLPFDADASIAELIAAIVRGPHRPPRAVRPSLPPALDAWFDRALAKSPKGRFASGAAMSASLDAALRGRRAPSVLLLAAAAGGFGLAVALVILGARGLTSDGDRGRANAGTSAAIAPAVPSVASAASVAMTNPAVTATLTTTAPATTAATTTTARARPRPAASETPNAGSAPTAAVVPAIVPRKVDPSEIQ